MNPIFKHGPSPQHRLILVLFCSGLLIFFDHKVNSFEFARGYLQSMVSPLQYLATAPKQMMNWAAENIVTRRQLIADNEQYKINELTFHEQALQLDIVQRENARLRALLASPLRGDAKKMVAEILAVDSDPYTLQVVINRGANDGVYEGQAVIDDEGIVGQILHVGTTSSRVLLITGVIDALGHNHVPHSTDIRVDDMLVTSGLGGKFPEGYPVARVTSVLQDESRAFSQIQSQPVAKIDRLRYVLLLWPEQGNLPPDKKIRVTPGEKAKNK